MATENENQVDTKDANETSGTSPTNPEGSQPDESFDSSPPQANLAPALSASVPSPTSPTIVSPTFPLRQIALNDPHRLGGIYLFNLANEKGVSEDKRFLVLRFWRAEWFLWDGKKHSKLSEHELQADVSRIIRLALVQNPPPLGNVAKVTRALTANVLHAISGGVLLRESEKVPCWTGPSELDREYVSVQNGLLDFDSLMEGKEDVLRPHTPEWFAVNSFPFAYTPEAQCPRWIQFLDEVLERDEERIAVLQEWFGYCLTHDVSQSRFMLLQGEGANGKSVVCAVLTAMLGRENVSNVPLELFDRHFQLTATLGKLANIASEISECPKRAEGLLKQFVAGDKMHFDRKYLSAIEVNPTARLLFATNHLPRFTDSSDGVFRRIMIVPFGVQFPEAKQDKFLINKLIAELPGIFLWAIEGLRRLRKNGQFTAPEVSNEALKQSRLESHPSREFLEDCCEFDPLARTKALQVYGNYSQWAAENGVQAISQTEFGKEVRRVFPEVKKMKRGGRGPGARYSEYVGLKMRSESEGLPELATIDNLHSEPVFTVPGR